MADAPEVKLISQTWREQRLPFARARGSRQVACLPDLAMIGYIPYPMQKLTGAYAEFWPRTRFALRALFASGNAPPPSNLEGVAGLRNALQSKDFRVALALTGVTATLSPNGDIDGVSLTTHVAMGYTPFRWEVLLPVGGRYASEPWFHSEGHPKNGGLLKPSWLMKEVDRWDVSGGVAIR